MKRIVVLVTRTGGTAGIHELREQSEAQFGAGS
jgi:hypothetical protein